MPAPSTIRIQTWVFPAGQWNKPTDRLIPLRLAGPLPRTAPAIAEGAIDLHIDDLPILSHNLTDWGYVENWWRSALAAIEHLLHLHPAVWPLEGKVLHLSIDPVPNTRRANIQLRNSRDPSLSGSPIRAHIPTLADALLAEAELFFRWRSPPDAAALQEHIDRLRSAPAPWRSPRSAH